MFTGKYLKFVQISANLFLPIPCQIWEPTGGQNKKVTEKIVHNEQQSMVDCNLPKMDNPFPESCVLARSILHNKLDLKMIL